MTLHDGETIKPAFCTSLRQLVNLSRITLSRGKYLQNPPVMILFVMLFGVGEGNQPYGSLSNHSMYLFCVLLQCTISNSVSVVAIMISVAIMRGRALPHKFF